MELSELIKVYGNVKVLTTPSGNDIIIREQNGDDDAILSNLALNRDSNSVNAFIQAIVVGPKVLSLEEVQAMRLGDKYFILISSRIFSIGPIVKFEYKWEEGTTPVMYEENLERFVWDYSLPLPLPGSKAYSPDFIKPYPKDTPDGKVYLTLLSGKEIRYDYLNGQGEQYLLKLPDFNTHINSKIIARNLELKVDSKWVPVESFSKFTSKEMGAMRDHIELMDPQFEGNVMITNPATGEERSLPLIGLHDFFFQRGI